MTICICREHQIWLTFFMQTYMLKRMKRPSTWHYAIITQMFNIKQAFMRNTRDEHHSGFWNELNNYWGNFILEREAGQSWTGKWYLGVIWTIRKHWRYNVWWITTKSMLSWAPGRGGLRARNEEWQRQTKTMATGASCNVPKAQLLDVSNICKQQLNETPRYHSTRLPFVGIIAPPSISK
jgi:hypothetical protein